MKHEKFLILEVPAGKTPEKVKLASHIEGKITPKSISIVTNPETGATNVVIGYAASNKKHTYDLVAKTVAGLDKIEAQAEKLEGVVCQHVEYVTGGKYKVTFLVATPLAA